MAPPHRRLPLENIRSRSPLGVSPISFRNERNTRIARYPRGNQTYSEYRPQTRGGNLTRFPPRNEYVSDIHRPRWPPRERSPVRAISPPRLRESLPRKYLRQSPALESPLTKRYSQASREVPVLKRLNRYHNEVPVRLPISIEKPRRIRESLEPRPRFSNHRGEIPAYRNGASPFEERRSGRQYQVDTFNAAPIQRQPRIEYRRESPPPPYTRMTTFNGRPPSGTMMRGTFRGRTQLRR